MEPPPVEDQAALCGWLYKAGKRKTSRKLRWFCFNKQKFTLMYFSNPNDGNALGEIPLATATFEQIIVLTSEGKKLHGIEVRTPSKEYRLYHEDQLVIDYWRHNLQDIRGQILDHSMNDIKLLLNDNWTQLQQQSDPKLLPPTLDETEVNGAIKLMPDDSLFLEPTVANALESQVFVDVEMAKLEVGPQSNLSRSPGFTDVSIKKIATEVQNAVSRRKSVKTESPQSDALSKRGSTLWHMPIPGSSDSTASLHSEAAVGRVSPSMGKRNTTMMGSSLRSVPSASGPKRGTIANMITMVFQGNDQAANFCESCEHKQEIIDEFNAHLKKFENLQISEEVAPLSVDELKLQLEVLKEIIASKDVLLKHQVKESNDGASRMEVNRFRDQLADSLRMNDILRDENRKLTDLWLKWERCHTDVVANMQKLANCYQRQLTAYRTRLAQHSTVKTRRIVMKDQQQDHQYNARVRMSVLQPDEEEFLSTAMESIVDPVGGDMPNNLMDLDMYGFYHNAVTDPTVEQYFYLQDASLWAEYSYENDFSVYETSIMEKWTRYRQTVVPGQPIKRSTDLKLLVRNGVPCHMRKEIWAKLIQLHLSTSNSSAEKLREVYRKHLRQALERAPMSTFSRQVDLDLHRCMPENVHFHQTNQLHNSSAGDLLPSLRNVLLAFAELTIDKIGYCQGIDRIAAVLLLILPEDMAFTALMVMLRKLRSDDYYSSNLLDAQVDQRVFAEMLKEFCPQLQLKFDSLNIDVSLFTLSWFITLFIDGFSWKVFMKVLDSFLYEGDKIIFRYAVAVFIHLEPLFMKQKDAGNVMRIIRAAGRLTLDHEKLTDIAFNQLKHFPKRRINARRKHYRTLIEEEMRELQRQRQEHRGFADFLMKEDASDGEEQQQA